MTSKQSVSPEESYQCSVMALALSHRISPPAVSGKQMCEIIAAVDNVLNEGQPGFPITDPEKQVWESSPDGSLMGVMARYEQARLTFCTMVSLNSSFFTKDVYEKLMKVFDLEVGRDRERSKGQGGQGA